MTLIKTSLLSGIAVVVKVASAIVLNKILAIYVGPAGYAVIGQFQSAVSFVVSFAGGLVAGGVTKATAQHFDDEARQHVVWQSAIRFSLGASLIAAVILLFMSTSLAQWLLHMADMSSVFVWLALTLPAMAANNLLLAIVNGKKEIGIYVAANIIGSLLVMLLTGSLTFIFGLYGALVAFTINPAIVLLSTSLMVARRDWFKARFLWGPMTRPALRELSGFGLMALISTLTMPVVFMLIRDYLATNLGLASAGYWQAIYKISEIYLMLVLSTISVYYLPRLAEIRTATDLKTEIIKVYRLVMPVVVVGAVTIYLLRDFIISTMFTEDFLPMRELFSWQLAGDVVKIASGVLGYVIVGRGLVKYYLICEIFANSFLLFFVWILVDPFGVKGVTIAYFITYIFNFLLVSFMVRRVVRSMEVMDAAIK